MGEILYLDMVGGISGDMLLSALLHSGVPRELIEGELAMLPLRGYRLEIREEHRSGLAGLAATVETDEGPHHHHTKYSEIAGMIESSGIDLRAKALALRVFDRLAVAEASVHGTTPAEVEFHEVGAVDSIVDIVACSVALSFISASAVLCSIPVLGTGRIKSRHGEIPLPAPATLELLKGMNVRIGPAKGETITPTGAAFLAEVASAVRETPVMKVTAVGHGFGGRKTPAPNMLRVMRGEPFESASEGETVLVEATIDDMNPQIFPHLIDMALEAGALDAWVAPVVMKKGRPGNVLSILCQRSELSLIVRLILSETTSIGLRYRTLDRVMLARRTVKVTTSYGSIRIKVAHFGDTVFNASPEYEDCLAAAGDHGVPVKDVLAAAVQAYRNAAEGGE
jgi:uncharacterized protein (TIGR00299 family) protein